MRQSMRKILGEIIFWLHLPIVLIWLGLFLVPESLVPGKTVFHFWFIAFVFASQMLWGLVMMPIRGRFGAGVCALTTFTQWVRGYSLFDKRNYDHAFIQEFADRFHVHVSSRVIMSILFGSIIVISFQYFF